jgi:hypothetical protein
MFGLLRVKKVIAIQLSDSEKSEYGKFGDSEQLNSG